MKARRSFFIALALAALHAGVAAPAAAQAHDSTAIDRRAGQIVAVFGGATINFDSLFDADMLKQLPAAQLRLNFAAWSSQFGAVARLEKTYDPADSPGQAHYRVAFSKGLALPMKLDVDTAAPHRVTGLAFGAPSKDFPTLDAVMHELSTYPGRVTALLARIDGSTIIPIAALDTGRSLGIGSAFKLYVLAELISEVESGTRHWSDVVPLDSAARSVGSGLLQRWPAGAPITLESLATLMISQSDNTAADNLLRLLGRERVEHEQQVVGNTHFARNLPFLSTRELFLLKTPAESTFGYRYLPESTSVRREILATIDRLPYSAVAPESRYGPIGIARIEWFASAMDLARTMVWLRDHTASGPAAVGRDVLAVNHELHWRASDWPYVAYKGGDEPGVIDMTSLLRRSDGTWFVLTATWNDATKAVDESRFALLMQRASELLMQY